MQPHAVIGVATVRSEGTVKWFKNAKGYGFAVNQDGKDVFLHHNEIVGEGFKTLATGQQITFTEIETEKGLSATEVKLVE